MSGFTTQTFCKFKKIYVIPKPRAIAKLPAHQSSRSSPVAIQ